MSRLNTSLTGVKITFLLIIFLINSGNPARCQTETDKLYALIDTAWSFRSTPRPLDPESDPDDKRLRDMSTEALEVRASFWSEIVEALSMLDRDSLSKSDQINLDVFKYIVDESLAQFKFRTYLVPFNAEGGFHTSFGHRATRQSIRNMKEVREYVLSLRDFQLLSTQQVNLMKEGLEHGYEMPCSIVGGFDGIAKAYVTNTPEESVFWKPVIAAESHLDPAEFDTLQLEVKSALNDHVFPAYIELADFLTNEYIPACRTSIGTSVEVDGEDYYTSRIRYFTTLEISPEEVFDIGMREVKRIREEMLEIIDEVGFDGTFDEFLNFLRTDPQFYATSPHELLSQASYFAKKIDGKLPAYFGKLPRLSYGVEPVPDEIAPRYTGGRYVPGNAKSGRSGTYWVNTYKLESRPLYVLPSLTLHEAVPGHHLQISLAAELQDMPEFRSEYYISAFGEGWALYTEYLGKEMGIYETPYERFGALTYEMWRACRLVVDPGMHAFGWSRDSAVQFMSENTALSLHEINTEINRYIGWPGQAVSYKIGELKIRELREFAEEELGDQFDLRAFHDAVLANGSIPLFVLEDVIRNWIAAETTKHQSDKSD